MKAVDTGSQQSFVSDLGHLFIQLKGHQNTPSWAMPL